MLVAARGGDRGSLARLITMVESGGPDAAAVSAVSWSEAGRAHLVGLTGAPGAGKSTLTSALCSELRSRGRTVAVLAVDPTSPFSGGAILGDRIRMADHSTDPGVFIRSMATRGNLGGLALATPEAARVLDAAGYDVVIVETVGVGQVEVEVAGAADTTVVVVNPGWGDEVQAAKAGLMEVADVFVVNKADRPGADQTVRDIESMLSMSGSRHHRPEVLSAVATRREGVDRLADALDAHRSWLRSSGEGESRRERRARDELAAVITSELARRAEAVVGGPRWDRALSEVLAGRSDPWAAARGLLDGA
ncbi:MAG: methylmalonyl Co-A mutase-associated GTPase MeaB [Microthrixaceae bacterium]